MWDTDPKDDWEIDLGDDFATGFDDELDEMEDMLFIDDRGEDSYHVNQEQHDNYGDYHSGEGCCHDELR